MLAQWLMVVDGTSIRSEILPNVIMIQNKEKLYVFLSTRLTRMASSGMSKA